METKTRSDEFRAESPVSFYAEFKSSSKGFIYYDKPSKSNVEIGCDFSFAVVKEYKTVKGYCKSEKSGIYSNEVSDLKTEELTVKTFSGAEIAKGLWEDIKFKVSAKGGKFCCSVYAISPKNKIFNLQLYKCALGAWIDFVKSNKNSFLSKWVALEGVEEKQNVDTYFSPVFSSGVDMTAEELVNADTAYNELQDYLKNKKTTSEQENQNQNENTDQTRKNDWEKPEQFGTRKFETTTSIIPDKDDLSF